MFDYRSTAGWKFTAPHDWKADPMSATVACIIFTLDLWVWSMYYTESRVAKRHGKKFIAFGTQKVVLIHALAGVLETIFGLSYILSGKLIYAHTAAYLALLVHVPTGLILTPKVWGLKHITVPGYFFVGLCRGIQAYRVLHDASKLPDLWILLHTASMVRLVSYYITPWSSTNGGWEGDLISDPLNYTLSVSLATLVTLSFVYPPIVNLGALVMIAIAHKLYPCEVKSHFPVAASANANDDDGVTADNSIVDGNVSSTKQSASTGGRSKSRSKSKPSKSRRVL